jgi:Ca2+/Na+ antiporter
VVAEAASVMAVATVIEITTIAIAITITMAATVLPETGTTIAAIRRQRIWIVKWKAT